MSATLQSQPFDVYGRLPSGVTVLEASAGTGKTYTIAALAVRYVAAGIRLDEMLHEPPHADEAQWEPGERSRFGVLARRLWVPLLGAES